MRTGVGIGAAVLALAAAAGGTMRQDRKAPELEGGKEWFNTEKPVTMAELKGKVVLLDFWTYC